MRPNTKFTEEKKEVAKKMILSGKTRQETADALGISYKTLSVYLRGLDDYYKYDTFHVESRHAKSAIIAPVFEHTEEPKTEKPIVGDNVIEEMYHTVSYIASRTMRTYVVDIDKKTISISGFGKEEVKLKLSDFETFVHEQLQILKKIEKL